MTNTVPHSYADFGDIASLVVRYPDGSIESAVSTHPNWEALKRAVQVDNVLPARNLWNMAQQVAEGFQQITERVSVEGGTVFYDGDPIDDTVSAAIVRAIREGKDFAPLARFMENLYLNPQEHSRENLYRWLKTHNFSITEEGMLLGYKSVRYNKDVDGKKEFRSHSSGSARVNDTAHNGTIPQSVGDVVTMPRSAVAFDPAEACSTGLHIGSWAFANGFSHGSTVLLVEVNPRDVVSVPTDAGDEKMRVCRYTVLREVTQPVEEVVYSGVVPEEEPEPVEEYYCEGGCDEMVDDEGDYCDYC